MTSSPRKLALRFTVAVALAATTFCGCAASKSSVEHESMKLAARVDELEAANRQLQVRLDAYEASVTLIEDQVYALELAQRRRSRTDELDVVRVEPPSPDDPYAALYEEERAESEDYIDIVVSDDKLNQYLGKEGGDSTSSSSSSSSRPRKASAKRARKRTPKPSVVKGDRLPVAPMKKDGSGVRPTAEFDKPIDLYKAGLKHYRQEQFEPAIGYFERFLESSPPKDYVDNALYWIGECHYGLKDYGEAAAYFHRIVQDHPDANKVPDALLKVGLTYLRLDKHDSAREVMYYLMEAYPKTEAARVARDRLDTLNAS